jgi:hypothetical protein
VSCCAAVRVVTARWTQVEQECGEGSNPHRRLGTAVCRVMALRDACSLGPGSSEGRRSIGTLLSRAGLWGEPVDHSLVETSIAAWLCPEPISILRGWACSATGSVTVSTPWS